MTTPTKNSTKLRALIETLEAKEQASAQESVAHVIDAARYRFLRNEDNWCDDTRTWVELGALTMTEFDEFVDAKISSIAQSKE